MDGQNDGTKNRIKAGRYVKPSAVHTYGKSNGDQQDTEEDSVRPAFPHCETAARDFCPLLAHEVPDGRGNHKEGRNGKSSDQLIIGPEKSNNGVLVNQGQPKRPCIGKREYRKDWETTHFLSYPQERGKPGSRDDQNRTHQRLWVLRVRCCYETDH